MIKIKKFDQMINQSQRRVSQEDLQSIKNTINKVFKSIKSVIYSEREKSDDEISDITYKAELAIQKILRK